MHWLKQRAGDEYRAFGIFPDYSSIGEIQDLEVVGPIATNEWVSFVDLIASAKAARAYRSGSTFTVVRQREAGIEFDVSTDYPRARPLFDWAGVRYIVLDKHEFDGENRSDHLALLRPSSGLELAYEDEAVTILESPTAQPKAFFSTRARENRQETTLARLQNDPRAIDGLVAVEADVGDVVRDGPGGQIVPVPLAEYRPNDLRATFEAPEPGVFVVKDSYFPGWEATLDGRPAEVIRVNGLVRGVVVPVAGRHEVTMSYWPGSFVNGAWMALATVALLLALLVWERVAVARRRTVPGGARRVPTVAT
jgi:hypothetical protein